MPSLLPQVNESELVASICRESFYEFVREFWDVVIPEDPIWNWHIEYLCDEMQKVAEHMFAGKKKKHDLIINISPGSTKSTICSVMFPAWVWSIKPTAGIIGGSFTYDLAMDLSRKNRDIIKCQKYRDCFGTKMVNGVPVPWVELRTDQDTKSFFLTTRGGMRIAVGAGGSIMGRHADIILIDDPLDPTQALSEAEIKSANHWMNNVLPTRMKNKAVTPTILIMQRLHQNDCTANMLVSSTKGSIKHICLPAELTDKVKPKHLRKYYKDGLMDPVRLSRAVLENYRLKGEYGYAGQFLQWPVPLGGGMFKTDRIILENSTPNKWKHRVRYWDKAATRDAGAYTVGLLMGKDLKGAYWVIDVIRGRWDTDKREQVMRSTAEADGRDVLIGLEQEPGSGGKDSALASIRNLAGYRVFVERPSGDKAVRADPFSVQVNNDNVHMVGAHWNNAYLNELEFFPESTYKDQVDASSGAFNKLAAMKLRPGVFK